MDHVELPGGSGSVLREDVPLAGARIDDRTEPFLAANGDVPRPRCAQLMRFHKAHDAELTIATHRQNVDIDGGDRVGGWLRHQYVEKPTMRFDVSMVSTLRPFCPRADSERVSIFQT